MGVVIHEDKVGGVYGGGNDGDEGTINKEGEENKDELSEGGGGVRGSLKNIDHEADIFCTGSDDFAAADFIKDSLIVGDMVNKQLLDGVLIVTGEIAIRGVIPGDTEKIRNKEDDVQRNIKPDAIKIVLRDNTDDAGGGNWREKGG